MNVLVIPEDFRKDQYMLKPVVDAMMRAVGRAARVQVCSDPLLGGIDQALNWERIEEVILRYKGMVDLFLLCVDRDGIIGRKDKLDLIEKKARKLLSSKKFFFAENAWQEIEVWVLAGHKLPQAWKWKEVRGELHPKEKYFFPFSRLRRLLDTPGEGRKILAQEAVRHYSRIRQLCPEIGRLEKRI